jgi:uncharacterized membrane protein YdjX (TVP38/TMEM64 family)
MMLRSSTISSLPRRTRHPHVASTVVVKVVTVAAIAWLFMSKNHDSDSNIPTSVMAWSPSSPLSSSSFVPSITRRCHYGDQQHFFVHNPRRNSALSTKSSSVLPTVRHRTMNTSIRGTVRPDDSSINDINYASTSLQPPQPRGLTTRSMKLSSDDTVATTTTSGAEVEGFDPEKFLLPVLGLIGTILVVIVIANGVTLEDVTSAVSHPQETITHFIETLKDMGPMGIVYFGMFYLIAETLAVPATPLALSAGYLFGFVNGFAVVLAAATAAACIGFVVGKTFLRSYVETILQQNPKFAKIDRAVGQKGFKLLVLVRLSPIFPFSISNYIYGASSIDFVSYFWGTLLGFTPSTLAYVYTGMVGKEVMFGTTNGQPWYVYVAGFTVLLTLLKLVTDVATGIIEAIDDDDATPN